MKCDRCVWHEMPNNTVRLVKHVEQCSACSDYDVVAVWRDAELVVTKEALETDIVLEEIVFKKYKKPEVYVQTDERIDSGEVAVEEEEVVVEEV